MGLQSIKTVRAKVLSCKQGQDAANCSLFVRTSWVLFMRTGRQLAAACSIPCRNPTHPSSFWNSQEFNSSLGRRRAQQGSKRCELAPDVLGLRQQHGLRLGRRRLILRAPLRLLLLRFQRSSLRLDSLQAVCPRRESTSETRQGYPCCGKCGASQWAAAAHQRVSQCCNISLLAVAGQARQAAAGQRQAQVCRLPGSCDVSTLKQPHEPLKQTLRAACVSVPPRTATQLQHTLISRSNTSATSLGTVVLATRRCSTKGSSFSIIPSTPVESAPSVEKQRGQLHGPAGLLAGGRCRPGCFVAAASAQSRTLPCRCLLAHIHALASHAINITQSLGSVPSPAGHAGHLNSNDCPPPPCTLHPAHRVSPPTCRDLGQLQLHGLHQVASLQHELLGLGGQGTDFCLDGLHSGAAGAMCRIWERLLHPGHRPASGKARHSARGASSAGVQSASLSAGASRGGSVGRHASLEQLGCKLHTPLARAQRPPPHRRWQ